MNLRGKGSVSQPKIPLEWADVRSAGQVPAQCGCEGGREERSGGGAGGRERTRMHLFVEEAVGTRGCVFRSDSTVHSISFHSTELTPPHPTWRRPWCKASPSSASPFLPYPHHSHL